MKSNYTDIIVVLDRSGSMREIAKDTIGGFNTFLSDQKKVPGTATISLHQFDDRFETVLDGVDIQRAAELTDKTFVPRGMTALLDAIGRSITEAGQRLSKLSEAERPEKVIFVVVTDGQENHSKEYSHAKIFEMITHQREKYSWEFVFLAANQDAISVGQNYGFARGNSMTYAATGKGAAMGFTSVSNNSRLYRMGVTKSAAFTDQDKADQETAKP